MEQKSFLFSALSVGMELKKLVVDGKSSNVTFDDFPYYLSERTKVLLTTILLYGPAELYQQMLAKVLAHYFESKLLLLDVADFSRMMQSRYGCAKRESSFKRSLSELTLERMSGLFGSLSISSPSDYRGTSRRQMKGNESSDNPPKLRRNASSAADMNSISSYSGSTTSGPQKRPSSLCFDEKLFLHSLYKVLVSVSEISPIILYIRDAGNLFLNSHALYSLFQRMLKKIPGSVLILGSEILDSEDGGRDVDEKLTLLFPYTIEIESPDDEANPGSWKARLEEDMKELQFQDSRNHIAEVLAENDIECADLNTICHSDSMLLSQYIEEIVVSSISHHSMNHKHPEYRNGKLIISANSLSHGLSLFQEGKTSGTGNLKLENNVPNKDTGARDDEKKSETEKSIPVTKKDGENTASVPAKAEVPDNEFEKRIRPEVIPANEIGVTFADIGALGEIKESLHEMVMLPLRRPDLFKGGLLKPCRGILLFGPPGTGKTMMAKAIANEAGASFINVSMSTITSKWFGEDEKNVRALFTLAAKVAPTIIFVDEVDSMLGQRTRNGEHEAMRKIKNEFMTHWDGLLTKPGEQILVLAATNRPFDLDEAIIRRFERRIMVGLPSVKSREQILKTLLSKEKHEDMDFKELAVMTEGYSGSDLKNLCMTAAYRPLRELMQKEILRGKEKKKREAEAESSEDATDNKESEKDEEITLRPLNMEDMKYAKSQIAASFASEGSVMSELKQWNDLYGEGGSRKKQQLSYFL
ncbi:hypothetical protein K1719_044490 [Acacia pycnantha]|nr:hypothetical protein K1719_044490 [Acacia pycnantha]